MGATSHQGWGSKIGYEQMEQDSIYDEYNDYNLKENEQSDNDDNENNMNVIIRPNWSTEGDGFTQTVYIGINTFWGLMLLSIFFGMISCSMVCAYLNFQRMFCKNGMFSIYERNDDEYKNKIETEYISDGLHTIDEDENVKFNVDEQNI